MNFVTKALFKKAQKQLSELERGEREGRLSPEQQARLNQARALADHIMEKLVNDNTIN